MKRPPGPKNDAEAGEAIIVYTDGPVAAVVDGATVTFELKGGRIKGGAGSVPRKRG